MEAKSSLSVTLQSLKMILSVREIKSVSKQAVVQSPFFINSGELDDMAFLGIKTENGAIVLDYYSWGAS